MKTLVKKLSAILCIITSVFFYSCSEEIFEKQVHLHSVNKNRISLSQFKKETKIKDFKTVIEAPITSLSEFIIDTVAIEKYVSENNKATYSFRIYTLVNYGVPDEKYNLVYTKENEVWEKSIVAFKEIVNAQPTENQFEGFEKLYDSRMTNITTNSISPTEVCITESYTFNCQGCVGACDLCPICVTRTVTVSFCPSSGDGTPSDPGQNPGDIGLLPSGSSEHESFVFTPNMYENPVFNDQNYINLIKAQQFFEHLEFPQKLWVTSSNENTFAYHQLINYLIQNNWSEVSKTLVNKLITVSVAHGGRFTIDNSINANNALVYNTVNEFETALEDQSDEGTDFEVVEQQNEKTVSSKFWIGAPYNGVKVNIKQDMTPPYTVENVTSEMFGVTIFADWHQSDYSVNITESIVTVDIFGVASVKVFFEGVGTIYHENQHFQIKINKATGNIISAVVKR
jgi:hypothetical protein